MAENKLIVNSSPHLKGMRSTSGIMLDVIIALIPAVILSVYFFSYIAALVILVSVASSLVFEFLYNLVSRKKQTIGNLSAVVTGVILALNLPPAKSSIWIAAVGSFVAIVIVKMLFGGLGKNIFNPAMAARVFLTVSFAGQMTSWHAPGVDGITSATPLAMAQNGMTMGYMDLFLGNIPGSLGETSALAILAGFIWLISRKVITWHIPFAFIASTALFTFIFGQDPLFHILSGGLMLGAVFMATDYVTSPTTWKGKLIFGFGCGLITAAIRVFGSLPEGVSFSILFMNAVVPLIDRYTVPKSFGEVKKNA
ncbi:MAG: RnfABCDGE type electron transport complex subunit D [Clostridia bacterium]